jgi:1-acyl-sn-glycerol-3-phosphate acyltransferase
MTARLVTYAFAAYFFLSSAFFVTITALVCLFTAPFDPLRKAVHRLASYWGYHYLQINPFWKCKFEGKENIPSRPCVFVANHQSYWDIMVLYGLHVPFKWVSKESLSRMPFIGWNLALNQCVRLMRGDLKSIKEMMHQCRMWLQRGASIMIFPEGTRSADGELAQFRDGPFKLAVDTGACIVPIVLDGTYAILPKGGKVINFHSTVVVKVLSPVDPSLFNGNVRLLRESVYNTMKESLANLRELN